MSSYSQYDNRILFIINSVINKSYKLNSNALSGII